MSEHSIELKLRCLVDRCERMPLVDIPTGSVIDVAKETLQALADLEAQAADSLELAAWYNQEHLYDGRLTNLRTGEAMDGTGPAKSFLGKWKK